MDPVNSPDPLILLLNEVDILLAQMRLFELYLKQAEAKAAYETSRAHEQSQAELARLRAEFHQSERVNAARQAAAGLTEQKLLERVKGFERELAEKQHRLDSCDAELQSAEAQLASLREQVSQLEISRAQAQASLRQSDETRRQLELTLADQQRLLEAKQREFQEQHFVWQQTERNARSQLAAVQEPLREAVASAQAANRSLEQANRDVAASRQRAAELESSLKQIQANAARELEQVKVEFATNLDRLTTALAEREQSLEQAQLRTAETERRLKTELVTLRSQLDQKQELVEFRDDELRETQKQISELAQRAGELELANQLAVVHADELDEARRSYERQVESLRQEVAVKERTLTESQEAVTAVELAWHGKIQELQRELALAHREINERDNELQRAAGDVAALSERIEQQESVAAADLAARQATEETRRMLEAENSSLHTRLAEKDEALRESKNHAVLLEERSKAAITQLQSRFEEQLGIAELAGAELERLRSTILALGEEGAEKERSRYELEENLRQTTALCEELESRLRAKNDDLRAIEARASEDKATAVRAQEAGFKAIAERLSSEINQLRSQSYEHEVAANHAREELARLRSDKAALEEQHTRSEQVREELERRWQEVSSEQQRLQAGLQAKDDELQGAISGTQVLKTQADARIQQLQLQLAETQLVVESRATETTNLKTELALLAKQLAARDSADTEIQGRLRTEIELARHEHHAQLAAVRDEYQLKQHNLEINLSEERQRVGALREQLGESERRVLALITEIDECQQELQAATAESSKLRSRLDELEALRQSEIAAAEQNNHQTQTNLQTDLAAVRQELQAKAWLSAQQQATLENLARAHKNQIHNLEAKIAEMQNQIDERDLDLEKSRSQARLLEGRIEELTGALQQVERATVDRAVQIKEEYGLRIAELERQLAQKTSELRDRGESKSELEQTLRQELDRLVFEAQERNQILKSRNDELVGVKAAMDALQERLSDIESAAAGAQTAAAAESERMHSEFQAQLALLQAELSQKEWALEERDAIAHGVEQNYREQIDRLRQQLEEAERRKFLEKSDFVIGEAKLNRPDEVEFEMAGSTGNGNQLHAASQQRRWQSGFGSKRRWKSSEAK